MKPNQTNTGATGREIAVDLGERSYGVKIGPDLIAHAGALLGPHLSRPKTAIVTDDTVAGLHLGALEAALDAAGIEHQAVVVPAGESSKSFATLSEVCDRLLQADIERGDLIVALGGGVIGDLAGFAASILRRGVRFAQLPSTLLAQVDSAVGGKTGINTARGKNLIGTFHQPAIVLADTNVLETLPARQFRAGYAEVVKYGLIADGAFFDWLEHNREAVFAGAGDARAHAIAISCETKARIVAADEREAGARALLNLGHTFGHALEAVTGYGDRLIHGEGVAIGIVMALELSEQLGHCPARTAQTVERHFAACGLPTRPRHIPGDTPSADALIAAMAQDKKAQAGKLVFILVNAIGDAFVSRDVPPDTVRTFIERTLERS